MDINFHWLKIFSIIIIYTQENPLWCAFLTAWKQKSGIHQHSSWTWSAVCLLYRPYFIRQHTILCKWYWKRHRTEQNSVPTERHVTWFTDPMDSKRLLVRCLINQVPYASRCMDESCRNIEGAAWHSRPGRMSQGHRSAATESTCRASPGNPNRRRLLRDLHARHLSNGQRTESVNAVDEWMDIAHLPLVSYCSMFDSNWSASCSNRQTDDNMNSAPGETTWMEGNIHVYNTIFE
jgi:hypothetical protein